MILTQDEAVVQSNSPASPKDEYRVRRGDFIAVVQPHAGQCSFYVRDTRREHPTIHGFGVDFPQAVVAVTELLDALTGSHG